MNYKNVPVYFVLKVDKPVVKLSVLERQFNGGRKLWIRNLLNWLLKQRNSSQQI